MRDARTYRLGAGAGFSSDRLDPAVNLVDRGRLDTIVFECMGERTLAFGYRDRQLDSSLGYNRWLERRMRAVLPRCASQGTTVVTNMGVTNPSGAARKTLEVARRLGLKGLKVAAVEGDDVAHLVGPDTMLWEGMSVREVGRALIGANAYLGADALLPALEAGADVVITGRVADPALFLAPLRHHFGWPPDAWQLLGAGTVVGHLLECAAQVSGGYFADPGYKNVSDLASIGFPIAEVESDGSACITKLEGTGGLVSERTVKEQLLYEVHDPARYLTPDVTADFSQVTVSDEGSDRVRVSGGSGAPRPEQLKATVAFDGGFLAEAGISYAGPGAQERGRVAGEVVVERLARVHQADLPVRVDLIGVSSLHATAGEYPTDSRDVRLRWAMRAPSREEAELLLWEVESLLCCGPAGGGGYRGSITPSVITYSASVDRGQVKPRTEVLVA